PRSVMAPVEYRLIQAAIESLRYRTRLRGKITGPIIRILFDGSAANAPPTCASVAMAVSRGGLNTSPLRTSCVHPRSINVVDYDGHKMPRLEGGFRLRCFQPLSA